MATRSDKYIGYVFPEYKKAYSRNIKKYPSLVKAFKENYLKGKILPRGRVPIESTHPLFWIISHPTDSQILDCGITEIVGNRGRRGVIDKLKNEAETEDIFIQIKIFLALWKKLKNSVKWEPYPQDQKGVDLLIRRNGTGIELEVFCVGTSDKEKLWEEVVGKLEVQLNRIRNNPFIISFEIYRRFAPTELPKILKKVRGHIKKYHGSSAPPLDYLDRSGELLLSFNFQTSRDGRGYVGTKMQELIIGENRERIRARVREKMARVQFSSTQENIRGFIIVLKGRKISRHEAVEGILGSEQIRIDPLTSRAILQRASDGIIQEKGTGAKIIQELDFIAIVHNLTAVMGDNPKEGVYVVPNIERNRITRDEIMGLFVP